MDKLPEMKTSLEEIFNKEKDPAKKLAVELLEELRSVQGVKWTRDGYKSFDSFAMRDEVYEFLVRILILGIVF